MKLLFIIVIMNHHHHVNGMRMCILLAEERLLQVSVGLDNSVVNPSWTSNLKSLHYV